MLLTTCTTCFPVTISAMCQNSLLFGLFLLYIAGALSIGFRIARKLKGEGSSKLRILQIIAPVLMMVLLIFTKGFTMTTVKGFLLFLLLLQASVSDIRTRTVSDIISVLILFTALIDVQTDALPGMAFALLVVGLPQYLVASFKPGTYGGADIKITSACAFLLGVWKGVFALIVGLSLSIFIPMILRLIRKQSLKEGIPMVPYLSFGILLAFIL